MLCPTWETLANTYACVKYWNDEISPITTRNWMVGEMYGRVILKKRLTGPAPSSSAAS